MKPSKVMSVLGTSFPMPVFCRVLSWFAIVTITLLGVHAYGETTLSAGSVKNSLPYLDSICVRIDRNVVALQSGTKFAIADGRPVLYWRTKGQADWKETTSGPFENLQETADGSSFRATFGDLDAQITIKKFIGDRVWRFSGSLTNHGKAAVELARFHYFTGNASSGLRFLELLGPVEQPTLRSGLATKTARADFEQFWADMGVKWARLAELIHDQVGWFVSSDTGALIEKWNSPGWGFGFVGPGTAFGEIGYRGLPAGPEVFLAVLLDNVQLDPGETRTLEDAIVWCGDWQSGLDVWARTCAAEAGVGKLSPPLVGYCSWYQKMAAITPEDVDQATREFSKWPVPPGGRTIQIDDGFQVQPGNWDPNDRFRAAWPGLARRIEATGSTPGLWLAPTTVHESHPIVKEHPDWLQRLPNGKPAICFGNWGPTYYLEPDHPEVRKFIRGLFKRFRAEGWKYFKIDFTYPITAARVPYDRKKTEFETLRDLYVLFREAAGPDAILNACVGYPARFVLGHVDVARLGGDVSYSYGAVRKSVEQCLTRTATNGIWYAGDPDCFAMRSEKSDLSAEEKRIVTGTIGLFGGAFLTSDFRSQWTAEEAAYVRQFWTAEGPHSPQYQYVVRNADGEVLAYRVSYAEGKKSRHRLAVYNWSDTAGTVRLPLADAHFRTPDALRLVGDSVTPHVVIRERVLSIADQPAHSVRIVDLYE